MQSHNNIYKKNYWMKKYEKSVQFMKNFRIRETLNLLACAVSSTDIIKNPKKIGTQNIKK